ncbi:hypothetical protein [Rehaibacterium terrae]|jgi:hypothetical protein|uniref:Uncharacterized protein n=1 Tax=Rehaibacterium terrae TaxID=1341696 RepID=A0A7W8DFU9_9GAMM|nr:hypothetical protein [Rehaibacterium terrae]MBB5016594.1 hypothetical protein [Rehaibacterium terrae]
MPARTPPTLGPLRRRLAGVLTAALLVFAALSAMQGVARNQVGETLSGTGLFLLLLPLARMPEFWFLRLREALGRGALQDSLGKRLETLAMVGAGLLMLAYGGRIMHWLLP